MKSLQYLALTIILLSCTNGSNHLSSEDFNVLMQNVSKGWSTQNTELALSSFTQDAIYMQPPNAQFYQGHEQLRPYFDALDTSHQMEFHNLWFDVSSQTGAGEFTFSYGEDIADVGIAVVELQNGKIRFWREYLTKGPTDFRYFLDTKNKDWQWHIGNYPAPKDSLEFQP